MSTSSSPFGSHDLNDVFGVDLDTAIAAFEDDIERVDPELAIRVARMWQESLQQSDWPNAHLLAAKWGRLEDTLLVDDVDQSLLADVLIDLGEGCRVAAAETSSERQSSALERLSTVLSTAGEDLGSSEVAGHTPRAGFDGPT